MATTATIQAQVYGQQDKQADTGLANLPFSHGLSVTFASGTGAGQIDRVFTDTRTLTASSTEDLDLAGVLLDVYGTTTTFVRVKAIIVTAAPTNTNNVVIGAAAATQFVGPFGAATHTIHVRPGGFVAFGVGPADATGWPVSAGSTDFLRVANGGAGTPIDYTISILGCSA